MTLVLTVQYRTVPFRTVQYRAVPYSTMQYRAVPFSTVQYRSVPCSSVQYRTVPHSTVQFRTVPYSTVQYSTVQQELSTVQNSTVPHNNISRPETTLCTCCTFLDILWQSSLMIINLFTMLLETLSLRPRCILDLFFVSMRTCCHKSIVVPFSFLNKEKKIKIHVKCTVLLKSKLPPLLLSHEMHLIAGEIHLIACETHLISHETRFVNVTDITNYSQTVLHVQL